MVKRVAVEGNIGSGKSNLVQWAAKIGLATPIYEPVNRWQNSAGVNLLQLFYADQRRWAFPLQSLVQLTMFENAIAKPRQPAHNEVLFHDRTVMSSRYVFTEAAKQRGALTLPELAIVDESYRFHEAHIKPSFDAIIYLKCPPIVCLERVEERSRKEEKSMSLSYLQTLDGLYEDWLGYKRLPTNATCVVPIDATLPEPEVQKQVRTVIEYVRGLKKNE